MSTTMPAQLLEWLGLSLPSNADEVTWQLDSRWHWAPSATLLLLFSVIAWTLAIYAFESTAASRLYRALLAALRLVAVGLLLIMIGQWVITMRIAGPPTLALVLDRSASMSLVDPIGDRQFAAQLAQRLAGIKLKEASRLNLAKLLVTADDGRLLRELAERYRLEWYLAGATVERQPTTEDTREIADKIMQLAPAGPGSESTRLGDAVRQILNDSRRALPAAIILLTDGVTTAGVPLAAAAHEAEAKGVPILAVGIGKDRPPVDIELVDILVDDAVFVSDLVRFQIQIKATGLNGQPAKVLLRRKSMTDSDGTSNAAEAGAATVVAEQPADLPGNGAVLTISLNDRPTRSGRFSYDIVVESDADEVDRANNLQQRVVTVHDETIRVLMVQGYPSFEFRWLKALAERDRTIDLSVHLQDADPEYAIQDKSALPAFPFVREELFAYDVILFGDVDPRLLPSSTWPNLRAFVAEKGGGTAILAGPKFMPWLYADIADFAALLPVEFAGVRAAERTLPDAITRGFVVQPTEVGVQSSVMQLGESPVESERIWRELSPLVWLAECNRVKPAALVFAEHPTLVGAAGRKLPIICFQYVGPGRVLFHATDSTWRWRLRAGDTYFARYWMQAIRLLARGKLLGGQGVQLTADRREYRFGEPVHLRARFFDLQLLPRGGNVIVLADAPGQVRRQVVLHRNAAAEGVFDGSLSDLPPGRYEAVLRDVPATGAPPATRFTVTSPPNEFAQTVMDRAGLSAAAAVSGGKFYMLQEAGRLLSDLPTGTRVARESLPPVPLWNRWWILAIFLGCIIAEWVLRKRNGML